MTDGSTGPEGRIGDRRSRRRAVHLVVSGWVQGVGFRYFVLRAAHEAGLVGWVRNLDDGRVEVWAEGVPSQLDLLAEAVRRGPPRAEVKTMTRTDEEARGDSRAFEVRM